MIILYVKLLLSPPPCPPFCYWWYIIIINHRRACFRLVLSCFSSVLIFVACILLLFNMTYSFSQTLFTVLVLGAKMGELPVIEIVVFPIKSYNNEHRADLLRLTYHKHYPHWKMTNNLLLIRKLPKAEWFKTMFLWLERNTELAKAVDVMMAQAKSKENLHFLHHDIL